MQSGSSISASRTNDKNHALSTLPHESASERQGSLPEHGLKEKRTIRTEMAIINPRVNAHTKMTRRGSFIAVHTVDVCRS